MHRVEIAVHTAHSTIGGLEACSPEKILKIWGSESAFEAIRDYYNPPKSKPRLKNIRTKQGKFSTCYTSLWQGNPLVATLLSFARFLSFEVDQRGQMSLHGCSCPVHWRTTSCEMYNHLRFLKGGCIQHVTHLQKWNLLRMWLRWLALLYTSYTYSTYCFTRLKYICSL